jgi:hypothetical protein
MTIEKMIENNDKKLALLKKLLRCAKWQLVFAILILLLSVLSMLGIYTGSERVTIVLVVAYFIEELHMAKYQREFNQIEIIEAIEQNK